MESRKAILTGCKCIGLECSSHKAARSVNLVDFNNVSSCGWLVVVAELLVGCGLVGGRLKLWWFTVGIEYGKLVYK